MASLRKAAVAALAFHLGTGVSVHPEPPSYGEYLAAYCAKKPQPEISFISMEAPVQPTFKTIQCLDYDLGMVSKGCSASH